MKKLTLSQWEEKYIIGAVERFDQKYTMFKRIYWDPEIRGALKDWSIDGSIKNKAGHTLQDNALRWASRRGVQMGLFDTSKPNPSLLSQAIAVVMANPERVSPSSKGILCIRGSASITGVSLSPRPF